MTVGPLVNTIAQLSLFNSAAASSLGGSALVGSDYKALVCVFLRGGCDTNNVLIPRGNNPQAEAYAAERGVVGIPNGVANSNYNPEGSDETIPLTPQSGSNSDQFGLHPSLSNLADIFNDGDAAFVSNVGTLAEPTSVNTYGTSSLPRQLFSHSDQQTQWMSSIADQSYTSGWGARVADLYHDTWNEFSQTSMLITAAGINQLMNGGNYPQYTVSSSGAISLTGFGTQYGLALDETGGYRANDSGARLQALEQIMQYSHAHVLEDGYREVLQSARANEAVIGQAIRAQEQIFGNERGVRDFDAIFNEFQANSGIGEELKVIAKLIAGRQLIGNNRQIFFVDMSGFDTHVGINNSLPDLLLDVDRAIGAFNESMKVLATVDDTFEYDKVTTFQASDFNRTWTPNGTDPGTAGTDHAWGSHAFVMGGAVSGGKIYGTFPNLGVGTQDDVPSGSRGRWIPTTSVDEYVARLAAWFGIPPNSAEMATILPNLYRFNSPFTNSSKIQFI